MCVLCSGCSFTFEYNSVAASVKDTCGYLIIIYMCISNNRHRLICNQCSNIFGEKHNKASIFINAHRWISCR